MINWFKRFSTGKHKKLKQRIRFLENQISRLVHQNSALQEKVEQKRWVDPRWPHIKFNVTKEEMEPETVTQQTEECLKIKVDL